MFGKIIGTGSYVPENIVTNNDLTKIVETSDSWIEERTGVKQRHLMKNETTATMATEAAKRAVENAGIKPEEIDVIVVSTVSSNLILPNTACFVQEQIGAINAFCFDINTACTGFMMAYNTVQSYINSGLAKTALIIGAEGLSRIVDWSDRGTCILFGDGAGAAIVKASEAAVFETVMKSDGRKGSALTCYNGFAARPRKIFTEEKQEISDIYEKMNGQENSGTYKKIDGQESLDTFVKMDGQEIFRFAVKEVPKCINELMGKMNITSDDVDMFVLHQANLRICQGIAKRLKISMDKVPTNVSEYGNTSSACIPILLDELFKAGKMKKGDRIIMSGFGAGVTLAATYLEIC